MRDSRYVGIAADGYCDGGTDCGGTQIEKLFANTFTSNTLQNNNTGHDGCRSS